MNDPIKLYWFNAEPNFGDALNELLLAHYRLGVRYADPSEADAVGLGSILEWVPESFGGVVLGAGFQWPRSIKRFRNADLRILRGRLTAERCGAGPETVLGDPGLLAGRLLPGPVEKRHTLGLVPHLREGDARPMRELNRRYPRETFLIDVRRPPLEVLESIAACEHIASSSLHGLIVADVLGIPNVWMTQSEKMPGRGFKFRDYFSALGDEKPTPWPLHLMGDEALSQILNETARPENAVTDAIGRLDAVFARLAMNR